MAPISAAYFVKLCVSELTPGSPEAFAALGAAQAVVDLHVRLSDLPRRVVERLHGGRRALCEGLPTEERDRVRPQAGLHLQRGRAASTRRLARPVGQEDSIPAG